MRPDRFSCSHFSKTNKRHPQDQATPAYDMTNHTVKTEFEQIKPPRRQPARSTGETYTQSRRPRPNPTRPPACAQTPATRVIPDEARSGRTVSPGQTSGLSRRPSPTGDRARPIVRARWHLDAVVSTGRLARLPSPTQAHSNLNRGTCRLSTTHGPDVRTAFARHARQAQKPEAARVARVTSGRLPTLPKRPWHCGVRTNACNRSRCISPTDDVYGAAPGGPTTSQHGQIGPAAG